MNNYKQLDDLLKKEMVWIDREFYLWRRNVKARKEAFKQLEAHCDEIFDRVIYPALKPYLDLFEKYGHRHKVEKPQHGWLYTYERIANIIFKHPKLDEKCEIHINLFWKEDLNEKLDLRCYIEGADVFSNRDQSSYLYEPSEITPEAVSEMMDDNLPEIFKIMREEIFPDLTTAFDYKEVRDAKAKKKKAKARRKKTKPPNTRVKNQVSPFTRRRARTKIRRWLGRDIDDE